MRVSEGVIIGGLLIAIGGGIALLLLGRIRRDVLSYRERLGQFERLLRFLPIFAVASADLFIAFDRDARGTTRAQQAGSTILLPMLVPLLITSMPLLARTPAALVRHSAAAAVILGILSWIAGFTIGFLFLPAAVLLVVVALPSALAPISSDRS
jgi:hypothetical protein